MRRFGLALSLALCSLVGTRVSEPVHAASTVPAIIDLGSNFPQGINVAGHVVGSASFAGVGARAYLWGAGTMTDLGALDPSGMSVASAVNDHDEITGWAWTSAGPLHAFLYKNGMMSDLPTLGGYDNQGFALNNAGQVVGYADLPGRERIRHAVLWSGGTITDLGTLGGQGSEATGINDVGQIAGSAELANGISRAFLYQNGVKTDLGTLGGDFSWATGVNNAGQVAGYAQVPSGWYHAFLSTNGTMIDLGTLGGPESKAHAINDRGQVVGWAEPSGNAGTHAFLYSNGKMLDLNSLLPPGSGWKLLDAWAINDQGQIVGLGVNPSGSPDAFLLNQTAMLTVQVNGLGTSTTHIANGTASLGTAGATAPLSVQLPINTPLALHGDALVSGSGGMQYFCQGFSPTPPAVLAGPVTTTAEYETMGQIIADNLKTGGLVGPGAAGIATALGHQWDGVQADIAGSKTTQALNDLHGFACLTRAQTGKHLTSAASSTLATDAALVYHSLGGVGSFPAC